MYGGEKLVTVSVEATVADREVSKPIPLFFSRSMPMDIWKSDPQRQVHFVRDTLRSMLMHELDECLKVDGVRVFDPHKDDPK